MTIRARLTLWYGSVLFCAVVLIAIFSLAEVQERRERIHRTDRGMAEIVEIMLGIGVPGAALSVAGGWWLMRKSLAPLADLTAALERVNENTLLSQLPRSRNGDELDRLTEVFNDMTRRLHDSFQRVREFTLHASHELKTPLTVLCGEMEMALREEALPAADRERYASQLEELRRLSRIVNALTLLARADAGQVDWKLEPAALDELVRDNFADTQILAQAQGLHVELTECEPVSCRCHAHRLRQLFLNLADNAVKYNHAGGRITMALRRRENEAEFVIANTGPGIKAEFLPRVFDRFFRGDPAHSSEIEGSGLGLSIAQWIVRAHHGTIQIASEPDQWTTVTVRLPGA
ncbi:MAG TPA: ATP-binding protein [Verrucomicrobiae bacterium]|jgi:signal transduction histidine kinase|nr:ATP-binding protein [Verrucomicrobiae bacterium]